MIHVSGPPDMCRILCETLQPRDEKASRLRGTDTDNDGPAWWRGGGWAPAGIPEEGEAECSGQPGCSAPAVSGLTLLPWPSAVSLSSWVRWCSVTKLADVALTSPEGGRQDCPATFPEGREPESHPNTYSPLFFLYNVLSFVENRENNTMQK